VLHISMAAVHKMQGADALQVLWTGMNKFPITAAIDRSHVALNLCSVDKDGECVGGWSEAGRLDSEALASPAAQRPTCV
jgi:hypothetical protein